MGTGYITHADGTEEVISYSCDGAMDMYCYHCGKVTTHYLSGVSNVIGYIWSFMKCNREANPYE